MVVVTSEGLVRVDDREGRSASGDCEGDSNKYEDFSHGRILSKKYLELYHRLAKDCDGYDKKLRRKFNCEGGDEPALVHHVSQRHAGRLMAHRGSCAAGGHPTGCC